MKIVAFLLLFTSQLAISTEQLVPDPGEEGRKSLPGIDSDKDGIRDDVQRMIIEKYGKEDNPNIVPALKQFARAYQKVLETVDVKEENIKATRISFNAIYCLTAIEGEVSDKTSIVQAKFLNTKERLQAYKKADLNFHGQSGKIPDDLGSYCNFQVKSSTSSR